MTKMVMMIMMTKMVMMMTKMVMTKTHYDMTVMVIMLHFITSC